jgi:hypothetical protein
MGELSERQKVARQKQKSEVVAHDKAPVDQMMSAGLGARSSFFTTTMTDENPFHRVFHKCWKVYVAIVHEHAVIELG